MIFDLRSVSAVDRGVMNLYYDSNIFLDRIDFTLDPILM